MELRRRQAVHAVQQGDRVEDVARITGVSIGSVRRWLHMAQAGILAAKPHPGPAPKLNPAQQQELVQLLLQGAKAYGWSNDLWTTQRIADLIDRHFGIRLHHDHVGRFLRERLKWSVQKPCRQAKERNEEAIAAWRQEAFPKIAEDTRKRQAHLVFL